MTLLVFSAAVYLYGTVFSPKIDVENFQIHDRDVSYVKYASVIGFYLELEE